jgi:branched-chain amino acid transport system permease protein
LAKQFPEYWYFGIGLLLVFVVLFARGGVLGIIDQWVAKIGKRQEGASS